MSSPHTQFDAHDPKEIENRRAWESAPASFKREAEALGIGYKPDKKTGQAIEYECNYESASYTPDMAEELDTLLDRLVEKHGAKNEMLIHDIAKELAKPLEFEADKARALTLSRMAMFLLDGEKKNMRAKAHAFLHAVPMLAAANGFGSMAESARDAGVTKEWMRRTRDELCLQLQIPVPEAGRKSEEAKANYKLRKHWTKQKFIVKKQPTPATATIPAPCQTPSAT